MSRKRASIFDPFRACIFALILIALSRINLHLGLEEFRLAFVLAAAAAVIALFRSRTLNLAVFKYWPPKVVLAIGIMAVLSAFFGISQGSAGTYIIQDFSKVLFLHFLILMAIRDERDLRALLWAYGISCAVLAYYSLFVFELRGFRRGIVRLSDLYGYDSNDIGAILMTGLPFLILLYQTSGRVGRIASAMSLLGIGATVVLSGSRGTFVGLVVVVGALLFLTPGISSAKRVGFLAVVGLGMVIFAPPNYWRQMRTILNPTEDYNWTDYYGRRMTAERAAGYMIAYPVFGLGINNFPRAEGTLSDRAQNFEFLEDSGVANRWRAAHNSFLQAGAELGVPGLILWTSLLFGGAVGLRRLRRRLGPTWARGDPSRQFTYLATLYVRVAILGFAATSFFVSFAWLDPLYILAALVTGIYVCADNASQPVPAKRARRPSPVMPVAARGINARPT